MKLLSAGMAYFMSCVHVAVDRCSLGIGKLADGGVVLSVPALPLKSVGILSAPNAVVDMLRGLCRTLCFHVALRVF